MGTERLTRNAIMAVIQVIVSGGVLFLLYRYLLHSMGSERIGVWSIVLASVSASKMGELGLTASAVKFTAKYIACNEKNKASEVIETTVITIGVLIGCSLTGGYPIFVWLIGKIIPTDHILDALAILPYALVSIWIGSIAGVFLSGLDGCQRIDLRVLVSLLANIFFMGLTWLLVPNHGLIGLAWAQIGQGLFMLLGGGGLLRQELPLLSLIFLKWRYSLFREMFQYGANFQIASISSLLFAPITKALIAKFGGLSTTAYFDMAGRMVGQFRSLLISANQVIVPQVADLHENAPEKILKAYLNSYRVIFFLSLPLYVGVVAVAPLASELWIGHYEQSFVSYVSLLSVGYWFSTLIGPAYYVNLGTGMLRWNTLAHIAIDILTLLFGYMLGFAFGGVGVVTGNVLALVVGSSIVVIAYHRDHHIPLAKLFPLENKQLFFASCIGLLMGWSTFHILKNSHLWLLNTILSFAICAIPVGITFWRHPLRVKASLGISARFTRPTRRGNV